MKVQSISIVIPCFNEELTIEEFYKQILAFADEIIDRKFEFIFVNDGSVDKTGLILNKISENDKRVKVLHLAQNRGHQIALTAGLDHTSGDMIVTIDADLQDPPEIIREMLQRIEEGYDVVHAQRHHRNGETIFKLLSARFFYRLMRWFAKISIIEDCGDFRAITRPVLDTVIAFRTPHRFLRGIFTQIGFNQCVITYDRNARYAGSTKYPFFKMFNLSIDAILGFTSAPIRAITWFSIALWSVSLIYLIKSLFEHFVLHVTVPGWTSLVVMLIFFTGLILFCISILGAYVGRIFEQGKRQPLYWPSDARNIEISSESIRSKDLPELLLTKKILNHVKDKIS
jgi:dolichol-phosphate mannosyltransferase